MDMRILARRVLLVVQAIVAITAFAGGIGLILGSAIPSLSVLVPPDSSLEGTPFAGYLIPGILLAGLLGGIHTAAFVMLLRSVPLAVFMSAAAAFAALIWIFIQMIFIPFSPLQAVYFGAGIVEAGLVMVMLGLFEPAARSA